MRAIAVLMVIAFHANLGRLQGGFIGVDIFFVLSGYLISGHLVRELKSSGTIRLVGFYARRVRRLLPASLVMLAATIASACVIFPPSDQLSVAASALATFSYVSNLYFIRLSSDYFSAGSAGNPLLHTWSLAVEEQFYFIWPLLLLSIYRLSKARWLRSASFGCLLAWTIGAVGVLSFAASLWLTERHPPVAFFFVLPRAWEFAIGALSSQLSLMAGRSSERSRFWLGSIGLIVVLVSAARISSAGFPGMMALFPVLAAGAILLAGTGPTYQGVSQWLATAPLQWIGRRSYSLYLWHWPLLVFTSFLLVKPAWWIRLLCVAASFLLADLTYRLVENPVRLSRTLQQHAALCVLGSLVVVVLGSGSMLGWRVWSKRTNNYKIYGTAMIDLPEDARMGCENGFGDSVPHECDFGDKSSATTVVLFGDSHIEQWLPAFHAIADERGWKIALLVKSSCSPLAIPVWDSGTNREDKACSQWRDAAIGQIIRIRPAVVVLSNFSGYVEPGHAEDPLSLTAWEDGARFTFAKFHSAGVPTIFLRDTPWARFEVTPCLSRDSWLGTHECRPLQRGGAVNDGIYRAIRNGAKGEDASFIDMTDEICGAATCDLMKGGTIVYRDSGHLTGTYLRSLSKSLQNAILRAVPQLATSSPFRTGAAS